MITSPTTSMPVALLATGDEVCNGDILNSNAQRIALKLIENGIQVGMHLAVKDNISDIQTAIHFLLQHHQAIIITGGLGPTSDDVTRQALAAAFHQTLIFDEMTWEAIVARLNRFGYTTVPENNRQQALFPEGADIIQNPNGTAAGCVLSHQDKWIFMLPGPPNECLPMVDKNVLPILKANQFQKNAYYEKWFLFGISEGWIAEKLDKIAEPFKMHCMTGYRFFYPYVEFKLYSNHEQDFKKLVNLIQPEIQEYLIGDGKNTASELIKKILVQDNDNNPMLNIEDRATGGYLENVLSTPENHLRVYFCSPSLRAREAFARGNPAFTQNPLKIKITGLEEFWQQKKGCTQTQLRLDFYSQEKQHTHESTIPLRGEQVKRYAVEYISKEILYYLAHIGT